MAFRRSQILSQETIAFMLEEDNDDLIDPEPDFQDEEEEVVESVELVFNGQGELLETIHPR
jgi:hypothetical protein